MFVLMISIPRPDPALIRPHYIQPVMAFEKDDAIVILQDQDAQLRELWKNIPAEKRQFAYAEGKWTVQQVVQHLVDVERILSYRALCMARGEAATLPAFDENLYAANDDSTTRSWEDLLEEWDATRKSTLALYKGMRTENLNRVGMAGSGKVSAASIAWFIAAHADHHRQILHERYAIQ